MQPTSGKDCEFAQALNGYSINRMCKSSLYQATNIKNCASPMNMTAINRDLAIVGLGNYYDTGDQIRFFCIFPF